VPGRAGTVSPPTGGPGADHIGRIDEQHAPRIARGRLSRDVTPNRCSAPWATI
jgi:hypothetical protein